MTRRGSVVYYMTAVVFGSLFVSASSYLYLFISPEHKLEPLSSEFLRDYFAEIVMSFAPLILSAFLLRRVAAYNCWTQAWAWIAGGAATFVAIEWMLAESGKALAWQEFGGWLTVLFSIFCYGPSFILRKPLWLVPLPGLATAYVLFLVYRAFELRSPEPPPETGATTPI